MSQSNNGNDPSPKTSPSWGTKASYIGTGILIGLVAYPFVRKVIFRIQPRLDRIFDDLTGKAEDLAERASDLLARAKQNVRGSESDASHDHAHETGPRPARNSS